MGLNMEDLTVRAVTYFATSNHFNTALSEFEEAGHLLRSVEKLIVRHGFSVFTKRVSFPTLTIDVAEKLVEYVSGSDMLVSIGYQSIKKLRVEDAVHFTSNGAYLPILYSGEDPIEFADKSSKIIVKSAENHPLNATRIALGFHTKKFVTPYFPDSSSDRNVKLALAFLYPNAILREIESGKTLEESFRKVFLVFEELSSIVEGELGLPVKVDYSLSPWMDHSVARLIEQLGCRVNAPGVNYSIFKVNDMILKHLNKQRAVGFNEVMLPYAEDSLLITYGSKGLIRARDFLLYASTCVAGVDMVVVPSDLEKLRNLILDSLSIRMVKKKPFSFRAIPVSGKPGEWVKLGKFGDAVILEY